MAKNKQQKHNASTAEQSVPTHEQSDPELEPKAIEKDDKVIYRWGAHEVFGIAKKVETRTVTKVVDETRVLIEREDGSAGWFPAARVSVATEPDSAA